MSIVVRVGLQVNGFVESRRQERDSLARNTRNCHACRMWPDSRLIGPMIGVASLLSPDGRAPSWRRGRPGFGVRPVRDEEHQSQPSRA